MKLRYNGSIGMLFIGTWFWMFVIGITFGLLTPLGILILINYICKHVEVVSN